jgi:hypothetical protein
LTFRSDHRNAERDVRFLDRGDLTIREIAR